MTDLPEDSLQALVEEARKLVRGGHVREDTAEHVMLRLASALERSLEENAALLARIAELEGERFPNIGGTLEIYVRWGDSLNNLAVWMTDLARRFRFDRVCGLFNDTWVYAIKDEEPKDVVARWEQSRAAETYSPPWYGWTCFHCGETFRQEKRAREHFGDLPGGPTKCLASARSAAIEEAAKVAEAICGAYAAAGPETEAERFFANGGADAAKTIASAIRVLIGEKDNG